MGHFERMPPSPEMPRDERFEQAVVAHPVDSWVYIRTTKQFGTVEEVRPSADGPRIKVRGIGSVPIDELRSATEDEINAHLESKK